jgi:hypothetical protein
MSTAYGHRIERGLFRYSLVSTEPGTPKYRRTQVAATQLPHLINPKRLVWDPYCKWPQCEAQPEFTVFFYYVTGLAGRTGARQLHYCNEHAEKFALKNHLQMPAPEKRA